MEAEPGDGSAAKSIRCIKEERKALGLACGLMMKRVEGAGSIPRWGREIIARKLVSSPLSAFDCTHCLL